MAIRNNTPTTVFQGINDKSVVQLVAEQEQLPQHLPLIYIQASEGPEHPVLAMGGDATRIYGQESWDTRLPFYNHASLMASTILGEGNAVLLKRVTSGTVARSSLTLVVTVDSTLGIIQEYDRDGVTNVANVDVNGDPIFTAVDVVDGKSLKFEWVSTATFDQGGGVYDFSPTGAGDVITYPLLTMDATHIGAYGNQIGVRLWQAGPNTSQPGDDSITAENEALLYNIQLVKRPVNGTPLVTESLFSDRVIEFAFKPNSYDSRTNIDLTIQDVVDRYSDDGLTTGTSPTYGPLGKVTVHQNNLETVLAALLVTENTLAPETTTDWMLNLFTGVDNAGVEHYGFQVDTTGATLSESRTQYLVGGLDGDNDLASFDAAVGVELDSNYENSAYPLLDSAQYPFSTLYDSGFTLPVKKKLLQWIGRRPDVHVTLGTKVIGDDTLTASEEISVGIDLRSTAQLYTESVIHGTGVTRVTLVSQEGTLISSPYKDSVSLIFDLAQKRARYIGAGTGKMKAGLAYDSYPRNTLLSMKDVSNTYLGKVAKEAVWSAGLNFVQYSDRGTLFNPGYQTVYGIKNSVLTSEIIMQIACDVTRLAGLVWTRLSGNSSLTQAQFIQRSNKIFSEMVAGRYDNRVTVEPNTYFTAADTARGYSWTLDATISGNVMRTVETINVITKRQ